MNCRRELLLKAAVCCSLLALGCSPNVVLGTRDRDAAVVDAAEPQPPAPRDAATVDADDETMMMGTDGQMVGMSPGDLDAAMPPEPPLDAGRDAGAPAPTGDAGECTESAQCASADEPFCNVAMAECVECLSDDNCPADEFCEPDGDCETRPTPCMTSSDCAGVEDEPVCHLATLVCVECNTDSECTGGERCQPDGDCD